MANWATTLNEMVRAYEIFKEVVDITHRPHWISGTMTTLVIKGKMTFNGVEFSDDKELYKSTLDSDNKKLNELLKKIGHLRCLKPDLGQCPCWRQPIENGVLIYTITIYDPIEVEVPKID